MCVVCERYQNKNDIIMENDTCFAVREEYPVNFGHVIIATINCKENYFALSYDELKDMDMMIKTLKRQIDITLKPDGYNIGFNNGEWAGQEIPHCVAHLIPRYAGDVPPNDLVGGIKNFKRHQKRKNENE